MKHRIIYVRIGWQDQVIKKYAMRRKSYWLCSVSLLITFYKQHLALGLLIIFKKLLDLQINVKLNLPQSVKAGN